MFNVWTVIIQNLNIRGKAYSKDLGYLFLYIIVGVAFSRDFTTNLAPQCRVFSRALKIKKFKSPARGYK